MIEMVQVLDFLVSIGFCLIVCMILPIHKAHESGMKEWKIYVIYTIIFLLGCLAVYIRPYLVGKMISTQGLTIWISVALVLICFMLKRSYSRYKSSEREE